MAEKYTRAYEFFETLYKHYNVPEYIKTDPIRFPHELDGNKEFTAFTASCFAYGNMKAIQGFLFKYFEYAGTDPLKINDNINPALYYRFQTAADVAAYSRMMKRIYEEYGSLQALFRKAGTDAIDNAFKGIELLRTYCTITNGLNFLTPVPAKSASKRLNMFLRWMIRRDDVDLGLWDIFDKSKLYMPADTHILRMAQNLGITGKSETGKSAVIKVTDMFRAISPDDPAKYDFAVTRLGIVTGCKYSLNEDCSLCKHNSACLFN